MGRAGLASVRHQLGRLFGAGTLSGASESELLRRFASRDDEIASELIVARHGPMVLGVCRRLLRDPADVEDAYQATFLVLARRAGSIRDGEALGPWLFGVAYRVALRARSRRARLSGRETSEMQRMADVRDPDPNLLELAEILDREIQSLPSRLRSVFVLCQLEGRSYTEAAERLGWTEGMVRGRLARARDRLRVRLTRRGVAPTVPFLARLADLAAVTPPRLVAGLTPPSPNALELAEGVLKMMRFARLGPFLASTFVLAALGVATLARPVDPQPQEAKAQPANKVESKMANPKPDKSWYTIDPPDLVIVEVLEALPGRPIQGEHLVRPDGTIGLGFYGDVQIAGLTRNEAKAKIVLHLREYLTDEVLGLEYTAEETGKRIKTSPEDSSRVFVDVSAYNSKVYYIEGEFVTPYRVPWTGNVRVLDLIHFAGGLLSTADPASLRLLRNERGKVKSMPINYEQIMAGDDLSTNHEVIPGDRLVVDRRGDVKETIGMTPEVQAINRRIEMMDRKLDQILSALKNVRSIPDSPAHPEK